MHQACVLMAELLRSAFVKTHSGVWQDITDRYAACVLPQVHNDLKTKNILLSEHYETAKIGAPVHLCASCRMATVCVLPIIAPFQEFTLSKYCSACWAE